MWPGDVQTGVTRSVFNVLPHLAHFMFALFIWLTLTMVAGNVIFGDRVKELGNGIASGCETMFLMVIATDGRGKASCHAVERLAWLSSMT